MAARKIYPLVILTVAAILLSGCEFTSMNQNQQSTPQYSSPLAMTEALMSDPNYLKECRAKYPTKTTKQQIYRNIIPGQTTSTSVSSLIGLPNGGSMSDSSAWYYDNFTIYFKNDLVNSIYVRNNSPIASNLEELLRAYGCPNFIFAVDMLFDNFTGNYNSTVFVYFDIGFDIKFLHFPIPTSDISGDFVFYQPESFQAYMNEWGFGQMNFNQGKPVTWNEAIKR